MDNISNKELRLLVEIITDDYRKAAPRKPLADYIQLRIYEITGLSIAKSKIIKVKPFKKIVKKELIEKNKRIKVIRKRRQKRNKNA